MRTGIFEDEQFYICHDGRELRHLRTENKEQDGYTQTFEIYGCADCSGCEHKARCLYKYDVETSKKTRTFGALTTARQIRYIKNSCYMPLPEI